MLCQTGCNNAHCRGIFAGDAEYDGVVSAAMRTALADLKKHTADNPNTRLRCLVTKSAPTKPPRSIFLKRHPWCRPSRSDHLNKHQKEVAPPGRAKTWVKSIAAKTSAIPGEAPEVRQRRQEIVRSASKSRRQQRCDAVRETMPSADDKLLDWPLK